MIANVELEFNIVGSHYNHGLELVLYSTSNLLCFVCSTSLKTFLNVTMMIREINLFVATDMPYFRNILYINGY